MESSESDMENILKVDQTSRFQTHTSQNSDSRKNSDSDSVTEDSGLEKTRSSYVSESKPIEKKGRSIYGRLVLIFEFFLVSLVILTFLVALPVFGGPIIVSNIWAYLASDSVLFGMIFIIGGWLEVSLNKTIKDIPTIKIDAAAAGVNEVNATFVPEKDNELISPMSNQRCVFYSRISERYVQEYAPRTFLSSNIPMMVIMNSMTSSQRKSSQHWERFDSESQGIPTLLTDGTGYLAIDLANADINLTRTYYYTKSGVDNFRRGGSLTMAHVGDTRIIETVIPTNAQYFVVGRVSDVLGKLNGKPVKLMSYDSGIKLLTVRSQSKEDIERSDIVLSFASFAIGILFVIIGLGYFNLV